MLGVGGALRASVRGVRFSKTHTHVRNCDLTQQCTYGARVQQSGGDVAGCTRCIHVAAVGRRDVRCDASCPHLCACFIGNAIGSVSASCVNGDLVGRVKLVSLMPLMCAMFHLCLDVISFGIIMNAQLTGLLITFFAPASS